MAPSLVHRRPKGQRGLPSLRRGLPSCGYPVGRRCAMLQTRLCELFGIRHQVVLGGMGSATDANLATAVCAQGTEGGGHVGLMGTLALVPQVVAAVAPVPVIAAGGIATGEGLAAALALGAEGVLVGTRFLATPEAPIAEGLKQAVLASD